MRRVIRKVFNEGDSADADARGAGVAASSRPPGPTSYIFPLFQPYPLPLEFSEIPILLFLDPSPFSSLHVSLPSLCLFHVSLSSQIILLPKLPFKFSLT